MIKLKYLLLSLSTLILFVPSCVSIRKISHRDIKTVEKIVEQSPVFSKQFTGFVLYDPATRKTLIDKNGSKYFTPASNTKILTFYTALKILGDSLALLNYLEKDNYLYFWGTGNPLFLHPDFDADNTVLNFLRLSKKQLRLIDQNFKDGRFGEGWMWDDYNYYFQVEKSQLPMYGNAVRFTLNQQTEIPDIQPFYFNDLFKKAENKKSQNLNITRKEFINSFEYNLPNETGEESIVKNIPFTYSRPLLRVLLGDTLGKVVFPASYMNMDSLTDYNTLYQPMPDTLYRRLMLQSDNFIAEQLLLMCSDKVYGIQNTQKIIEYSKAKIMADLPDEVLWVDASGVSRYNMSTPRTLVEILNRLYREFPEKRLFSIFPAGGKSGTIEYWYGSGKPYIFAKTGTLRNNHCLSGYIKTDSGKMLIFSFMNNHFKGSSAKVKKEMQKVLEWVRKHY